MRSYRVVGPVVVFCVLCLTGLLQAQRSDRGIITGIITDPSGSAVQGATVKVRNEGTAVDTVLTTNDAGAYTTPPLVLGTYSVIVDHEGFKTTVNSGILLQGAETLRQDISLKVGSVSESVEVKSEAEQLNVSTPDVSHTVDQKYYKDIPIITASDVRLAESVLQIQPGYLPMKPNGDPMFRGSQFNSRINGGQTMATENSSTAPPSAMPSVTSRARRARRPAESVQEMKVITTTYSAQYGHTSGGFIEYTSKSGTNDLPRQRLRVLRQRRAEREGLLRPSRAQDAASATTTSASPRRAGRDSARSTTATTRRSSSPTSTGRGSAPACCRASATRRRSMRSRHGDFSALLERQPDRQWTRWAGRSSGARFSIRATTRQTDAWSTAIPGARSRIPAATSFRRRSDCAAPWPQSCRPDGASGSAGNCLQRGRQSGRRPDLGAERAQHPVPPRPRVHAELPHEPQLLLEPAAVDPELRRSRRAAHTQFDGETEPEKNTDYYGNGFYQRISTHHAHQQFDWIITPQPAEPHHGGLRPLVHGREPAVCRRRLAADTLWRHRRNNRRAATARPARGPAHDRLRGQHPVQHDGAVRLGKVRLPGQQPLAVLGRPDVGEGQAHDQESASSTAWHQFPFRGLGDRRAGGEFDFNRLGTAGYDAAGNNLLARPAIRSPRSCWARCSRRRQTIPVHPTFREGYTAPWINDEFKVSDQADVDARPALRLSVGAHRRCTTSIRHSIPNTPNPGAGNIPAP